MPEMDGHAAVEEIRAIESLRARRASRAIIVMTTGLNDEDNVRSARELCDAYLLKPINIRKLRSHLQSVGLI